LVALPRFVSRLDCSRSEMSRRCFRASGSGGVAARRATDSIYRMLL
jgi:hypothetical protein